MFGKVKKWTLMLGFVAAALMVSGDVMQNLAEARSSRSRSSSRSSWGSSSKKAPAKAPAKAPEKAPEKDKSSKSWGY